MMIEISAPPAIAVHSMPDTADCGASARCNVSEKMMGNMIELNSPMPSAA